MTISEDLGQGCRSESWRLKRRPCFRGETMRALSRFWPLVEIVVGLIPMLRKRQEETPENDDRLSAEEIEKLREWIILLREMQSEHSDAE